LPACTEEIPFFLFRNLTEHWDLYKGVYLMTILPLNGDISEGIDLCAIAKHGTQSRINDIKSNLFFTFE